MRRSGWRDVTDVSRNDGHSVHQCGGAKEAIDVRDGIDGAEPAPAIGHRAIHVDDTTPEPSTGSIQRGAQGAGGARVAAGDAFGAAPQFPQRQDADEQLLRVALSSRDIRPSLPEVLEPATEQATTEGTRYPPVVGPQLHFVTILTCTLTRSVA